MFCSSTKTVSLSFWRSGLTSLARSWNIPATLPSSSPLSFVNGQIFTSAGHVVAPSSNKAVATGFWTSPSFLKHQSPVFSLIALAWTSPSECSPCVLSGGFYRWFSRSSSLSMTKCENFSWDLCLPDLGWKKNSTTSSLELSFPDFAVYSYVNSIWNVGWRT